MSQKHASDEYPIEEVEWVDSTGCTGWAPMNRDLELISCRTVGRVVSEDRERISLAQSVSDQRHCDHVLSIPKSCIRKRWTIR